MNRLHEIQDTVERRVSEIVAAHGDWPCRKGCDHCCRRLASVPVVTADEWDLIAGALGELPTDVADDARQRIRESAEFSRPIICPLLDLQSGTCLVYRARPIACGTYGFYAEREDVLGCDQIEQIAQSSSKVVWGNQSSVDRKLYALGDNAALFVWLRSHPDGTRDRSSR
jgi:Fe-S-cluster containining protein